MLEIGSPVLLMIVVTALAVVVVVSVVWLPRRRGPGLGKYVQQALALALTVALALTAVFLTLNNQNHWYGQWSDLAGGTGRVTTSSYGAQPAETASYRELVGQQLTDLQRSPTSNPALGQVSDQDADGQWLDLSIGPGQGTSTDLSVRTLVWLPPGYVADAQRSYPVVVAFPGVPGSVTTYQDELGIDDLVRRNVADGTMQAPIIVVPEVYPDNVDTECVDGAAGPWETWIDHDLRRWITTNLRAVPDRQAWALTGYSAGGWCSAMLGLRHPDHYAWAISLSGSYTVSYLEGSPQNDVQDPRYRLGDIARTQAPDVTIWSFNAQQDTEAMDSMQDFTPNVRAPTGFLSTVSELGGHRTSTWVQPQQDALSWLGRVSPWFAPAPAS